MIFKPAARARTVLITGASSGIGYQLTYDYAIAGHCVYACGRNREALEALNNRLVEDSAGKATIKPLVFDASNREQLLAAVSDIAPLDLVILNAGTCEYIDNARQFDGRLFERVINTNLIGTGFCLEALLPRIKTGGRVALMGSSATFLPFPRAEAYGASKAGLAYLAKSLAVDLCAENIGVSLIRPCFVSTPLTDKNDFPMPGKIDTKAASAYIRKGLERGKSTIDFTPGFIFSLRLLQLLPDRLWARMQKTHTRKLHVPKTRTPNKNENTV